LSLLCPTLVSLYQAIPEEEGASSSSSSRSEKEEMKLFIKSLHKKDTIVKLLELAKQEIPHMHYTMLGQRDEYMTNTILSHPNYQILVAVVGLAHVPGIESLLKEKGDFKNYVKD
jgi:pheromone shutdown protein TraB